VTFVRVTKCHTIEFVTLVTRSGFFGHQNRFVFEWDSSDKITPGKTYQKEVSVSFLFGIRLRTPLLKGLKKNLRLGAVMDKGMAWFLVFGLLCLHFANISKNIL